MLRLPADANGRAVDDDDPSAWWRLPPALVPAALADGTADVRLARFEGGGTLRLRLGAEPVTERPVPMLGGRLRFVLSTPTGVSSGEWHPIGPRATDLVDLVLPLSPTEAAVALRVGEIGGSLVEIEVELDYHGRLPRLPWIARADAADLRARLDPVLGAPPWSETAIDAALHALDLALFHWRSAWLGAPPRNDDVARTTVAAALVETLFSPGGQGWAPVEGAVQLGLDEPRIAVARCVRRWSFSAFWRSLADPARYFVDVERAAPFETRMLHVTCALPLGPETIDSLQLEVDAGEITGLTHVRLRPGDPPTTRVPFVHRSSAAPPRWRILALVRGRDGFVPVETPWRDADPLLVDLTPATTGIHPLRVDVDPDVWTHADAVDVVAGSRSVTLDAARPGAWLLFRQPPPTVAVTWRSGDARVDGTLPVREGAVRITTLALSPGEVVSVRLVPSAALLAAAAWVGIARGTHLETLEPEGVTWPVARRSRLAEPEVRFRVVQMPRRPDGTVAPPETSDERVGTGARVEV
jgi:hypothetical protein